jgi:hypothetical protein
MILDKIEDALLKNYENLEKSNNLSYRIGFKMLEKYIYL